MFSAAHVSSGSRASHQGLGFPTSTHATEACDKGLRCSFHDRFWGGLDLALRKSPVPLDSPQTDDLQERQFMLGLQSSEQILKVYRIAAIPENVSGSKCPGSSTWAQ